ncbi:MAG: DUF2125 domain-containing protein, partial [Alphaproteobacteria bacterium]|nr:DUF2125 domain-containing protein [Alphaproteobacteria bacterium]
LVAVSYTALWHFWAQQVTAQINIARADLTAQGTVIEGTITPVTGFPGPLTLSFAGSLSSTTQSLHIPSLTVRGFFLPGTKVHIDMPQGARAQVPEWAEYSSTLDALRLAAVVPSPLPASFTAGDLYHWQKSGGTLTVKELHLRKGSLTVDGTGAIALDDRLQPVAQMPVVITGHNNFLMELQSRQLVEPRQGLIAGAVLNGLSKPNDDGVPTLTLTLSIQKSTLYAGPIRIMDVPPLFWPE